jgi:5-methyltetrahydrofolate--homocysteine methyltransferase
MDGKGDYLKSHAVQSIAIESAEAFAELLHERLRAMWGFPDARTFTVRQISNQIPRFAREFRLPRLPRP